MEFSPCATIVRRRVNSLGKLSSFSFSLPPFISLFVCLATFLVWFFSVVSSTAYLRSRCTRRFQANAAGGSARCRDHQWGIKSDTAIWDAVRCDEIGDDVSEEKWVKTGRKTGDSDLHAVLARRKRHVTTWICRRNPRCRWALGYSSVCACRSGGSIEEIYWYCSEAKEISCDPLQIKLVY